MADHWIVIAGVAWAGCGESTPPGSEREVAIQLGFREWTVTMPETLSTNPTL